MPIDCIVKLFVNHIFDVVLNAHILDVDMVWCNLTGLSYLSRWSAPEALEDHKFSEKSDVWSFGVLVYGEIVKCFLPCVLYISDAKTAVVTQ